MTTFATEFFEISLPDGWSQTDNKEHLEFVHKNEQIIISVAPAKHELNDQERMQAGLKVSQIRIQTLRATGAKVFNPEVEKLGTKWDAHFSAIGSKPKAYVQSAVLVRPHVMLTVGYYRYVYFTNDSDSKDFFRDAKNVIWRIVFRNK